MNLQLSLKTNWFEMTKAGIKTEDYREITPFWIKRLFNYQHNVISNLTNKDIDEICYDLNNCNGIDDFEEGSDIDWTVDNWYLSFKKFTINTMTLGYPKSGDTERMLKLEHKGIEIRTGNPDWGAEPDKLYFVILHGRSLE